ncbi:MAG: hypothetical protein OHK006_06220 [Thermodesulfovibrionales bacterium]
MAAKNTTAVIRSMFRALSLVTEKSTMLEFYMSRLFIAKDLWDYLRVRKKLWLLPIMILLILVSLLIVFTEGTALSPFIYILF